MNLSDHLHHKVFQIIASVAAEELTPSYVIGGFVRDLLIEGAGNTPKDIDIVVIGSGIEMAEKVKRSIGEELPLTVFKNFGTAMLKWGDTEIEFVGARKESYRRNSRKPLVENGTLEDDQNRRDFTINALAISLNPNDFGELLDPFGGVKHLEEKVIITPLEPGRTFSDDPLRMLRGIRFATRLGFNIEPATLNAIRQYRDRIGIVSQERITDELNKIIATKQPGKGFQLLDQTGLLEIIFPELHQMKGVEEVNEQLHKDNFLHTLEVLDNIALKTDELWLRWAALLHDIAKPRTRKYETGTGWTFHAHEFIGAKMVPGIFRRLKLPLNEKMKYVQKLVQLHLRPIVLSQDIVTDAAVRRLIFDAGEDLEDLMTLCEADITSKNPRTVKRHLRNFQIVREKIIELEERDSIRNFQPPISGDDIQKVFGIPPSRQVGTIKNAIKEAILDGEIPHNFEAACQKMLEVGETLGLTVHQELKREKE
ncbi:MAG: CCA tRNA nucleotidyltransferase [Bacteroidales bacterium]|nr:CCA tRNA nucleotidyltransferase [Bacteroidales bacterium]